MTTDTHKPIDQTSETIDKLAADTGAEVQEALPEKAGSSAPVCLVVGAGDATGSAIAKRFASEGFIACVVRRNGDKLAAVVAEIEAQGGRAVPFSCDARQEDQMIALIDRIEREIGPIEVAVFNVGANVRFSILETTTRVYTKVWEMCALGGFHTGREAARVMVPRGRGTILFTGATASLRGGSGFSAFAGGKFALRALAQSMARELGPKGIHVAHPVIDGAIDTEFIRSNFPDRYAMKKDGGILNPDNIAEQYWQIHRQPRDTWTFEMDLRPAIETW
jgi:NAD(P)-dependent dehydrogenase (short-subunit alcohol dehydrogenase family)